MRHFSDKPSEKREDSLISSDGGLAHGDDLRHILGAQGRRQKHARRCRPAHAGGDRRGHEDLRPGSRVSTTFPLPLSPCIA